MIIYKRELDADDLDNLNREEELIYYKSDEIAITINIMSYFRNHFLKQLGK